MSDRVEHDSLGSVRVPSGARWGAQTQRAIDNFRVSGLAMPAPFIAALARIKGSAARVNAALGLLDRARADAIADAAARIAGGAFADQFPVDVFQTGSGTSSNMNVNEVIAHAASELAGIAVHPNDHVNLGQSSNDVVPSAIRVAAALELDRALAPSLDHLATAIEARARELASVVKTGRTHLMDAMPLTLGQELSGWAAQIRLGVERLGSVGPRLCELPLGGTAVGTGINAHPQLAPRVVEMLARETGVAFSVARNRFEAMAAQDALVELSGQLKVVAVSLTKIANDLRWMNSGPLAGLAEIELPALQPGSSIMPGKVNPVAAEAVAMVAARVIGNDASIAIAGQSGNFELNTMLPLIAYDLLQSIELLANGARLLADSAIAAFTVRRADLARALARNPILATALNPLVGYERAAEIAKAAYRQDRPILDVAVEMTQLPREELARLLDPERLTRGGLPDDAA
jgi:fumarate hydratase class II